MYGLEGLDWWEAVDGWATVRINGATYPFGRVTYHGLGHPYMLSEEHRTDEFFAELSKGSSDILIEVRVGDKTSKRRIEISRTDYTLRANELAARCGEE